MDDLTLTESLFALLAMLLPYLLALGALAVIADWLDKWVERKRDRVHYTWEDKDGQ